MSKIKTMNDLRNMLCEQLDRLVDNKIDTEQAQAISKMSDSILNTLKVELSAKKILSENNSEIEFINEPKRLADK